MSKLAHILLVVIFLSSHGMTNDITQLSVDSSVEQDGTMAVKKETEKAELAGKLAPAQVLHGLRHLKADKQKAATEKPCTFMKCKKNGKRAKREDVSATTGSGKLPLLGDSEEINSSDSKTSSERTARHIFPPFHRQKKLNTNPQRRRPKPQKFRSYGK